MDQSKKTMRHFYCRDVLWETFEQMANDFDCSVDYLVNEAMRHYARSKNYQSPSRTSAPEARASGSPPPTGLATAALPAVSPTAAPKRPSLPPVGGKAPPSASSDFRRSVSPLPDVPPGSTLQVPRRPAPPPAQRSLGDSQIPPTPQPNGSPTLVLMFNSQRFSIDKDQFIIGRGSKTSDLPIKDGNISRKHAAVIRRNGTYYIKDLGSTNGIDYKGMRIDNKRIDEGDVFHLCDYELRFTYR